MTTDVIGMLNAYSEGLAAARQDYHVTLGEAIDIATKISQENDTYPVNFEDGSSPSGTNSYRGYYEDLAIEFNSFRTSIGEFKKMLNDALNEEFTGYKGGEYIMNEDTPLWKSNYGNASGDAIIKIALNDYGGVIIYTKNVNKD